jgi:hypothetical protein
MTSQHAQSEVKVSIAIPQQWAEIDRIVCTQYSGGNPAMLNADFDHLACRSDARDIVRLVATRDNDILATQSLQVLWNNSEVNEYLGGRFTVDYTPVLVTGRAAANPQHIKGGGFRALMHTTLTTLIDLGEKAGGACGLNVHAAHNPLIKSLVKLGWQAHSIERTKGVFKGPQAVTYLPDAKAAAQQSLALLNASNTVPVYRFEGKPLADLLLTFKR